MHAPQGFQSASPLPHLSRDGAIWSPREEIDAPPSNPHPRFPRLVDSGEATFTNYRRRCAPRAGAARSAPGETRRRPNKKIQRPPRRRRLEKAFLARLFISLKAVRAHSFLPYPTQHFPPRHRRSASGAVPPRRQLLEKNISRAPSHVDLAPPRERAVSGFFVERQRARASPGSRSEARRCAVGLPARAWRPPGMEPSVAGPRRARDATGAASRHFATTY
jgi:hypothetical protein